MDLQNHAFQVRVPGSTSNLGAGFDTLSAALSLHLKVDVRVQTGTRILWQTDFELPPGENILERSLRSAAEALEFTLPGLTLNMRNPIPLRRGLGSSAAAIVAGIRIAERLAGRSLTRLEAFDLAYPLEGHPDNLAASFLGGWVLSWCSAGRMQAESLTSRLDCRFVLAVPEVSVSTREAREILPSRYALADAVFNVQRAALWVHALSEGKPDLLREAMQDRLHQSYRAVLVPGAADLLSENGLPEPLQANVLGIAVSGSGSALIALVTGREAEIGGWMVETFRLHGVDARFLVLDLDPTGAQAT